MYISDASVTFLAAGLVAAIIAIIVKNDKITQLNKELGELRRKTEHLTNLIKEHITANTQKLASTEAANAAYWLCNNFALQELHNQYPHVNLLPNYQQLTRIFYSALIRDIENCNNKSTNAIYYNYVIAQWHTIPLRPNKPLPKPQPQHHQFWKGEHTNRNKLPNNPPDWQTRRELVFGREGGQCQRCGVTLSWHQYPHVNLLPNYQQLTRIFYSALIRDIENCNNKSTNAIYYNYVIAQWHTIPLRPNKPLPKPQPQHHQFWKGEHTNRNKLPNNPPDWQTRRELVFGREGGQCQRCGVTLSWHQKPHVHHITRRVHGGNHDLNNLALLCLDCHTFMPDHNWMREAEHIAPWQPQLPAKLQATLNYTPSTNTIRKNYYQELTELLN